ncbi:MAG TPA: outer membrane lipoprotein-sorting protein [Candidatus Eisenbacteria bacterium]|nr:outer membrane lipoprotein-sorting protein [Candidatus Eisenbacteria bacterium]
MWLFAPIVGVALLATAPASGTPSADQIIAKYVERVGGMDKIQAVTTLRRTGKLTNPGGTEAVIVRENKRPNDVRQEFTLQGMTAINAYNGTAGWKISPFQGKKDPETLGEDEMKVIVEDSDFDDPLIGYQKKGYQVEALGTDDVEGTATYKLRLIEKDGDTRTYYLDEDSGVPIKIEVKRMVRGAPQESETYLGDYKEVSGWYLPFSIETGVKGNDNRTKITYDKIEANVPIDDQRFEMPAAKTPAPAASPASASTSRSGSVSLRDKD